MRTYKTYLAPILVVLASAVVGFLAVMYIAPLANLETKLKDIRVAAMQPPQDPSDQIVVIALDEATIAQFPYRSPIDRGLLAQLVQSAADKGARAIGVDVIIDQPTELAKDEALKKVAASVNVPVRFSFSASSQIVTPEQLDFMKAFVPPAQRMEANLLTDPFDGMVRRSNPGGRIVNGKRVFDGNAPKGFVPTMVELAGGVGPKEPVEIAWRARPDAENQPFPTFSASYLQFIPEAMIKGKIVLIGAVLSMTDRHLTPLAVIDDGDQGRMPGVLVQAHGISQFLEGRRPPTMELEWQVFAVFVFAAFGVAISLLRRGVAFNVGVAIALVVAYWIGAVLGYGQGLPMLPLMAPTLALGLSMYMMDLLIGRGERQQREFIQKTFSRYVAPAVVEELMRDPESATVSGKRREVTFIFTDVAGFTTLSEKLEPEKLSEVLNAYLDGACEIILKYQGTIDKFIGDAIMVVFNAPIYQTDHSERAVKCALEIDAYAEAFRLQCLADGVPFGITRIGIHRGDAVIGNFGSHSRMDFTALGDTVNTAARTEGVNKYFGTRLCCTQPVADACAGRAFRPIGDIVLKGKLTPTKLFVPVADSDDAALIAAYGEAYTMLEAQSADGVTEFNTLSGRFPDDPLINFHCKRIASGERSTTVVMDDK